MKETTKKALMEGSNIHIGRMDNKLRKTINALSEARRIIECAVEPGMASRLNIECFNDAVISRDIDIIVIHQAELLTTDHYIFMCNSIIDLGGYFPQIVLIGDLLASPYTLDTDLYGAFDFVEDTCVTKVWPIFEDCIDNDNEIVVVKDRDKAGKYNNTMRRGLKSEERIYKAELSGNVTECPLSPVEMRLKAGELVIMLDKRPGFYKPGDRGVITELNAQSIVVNINGKQCSVTPRSFGTLHNIIFRNGDHVELVKTVNGTYKQFPVAPGYAIALPDIYGMHFKRAAVMGWKDIDFVRAVKAKADWVDIIHN